MINLHLFVFSHLRTVKVLTETSGFFLQEEAQEKDKAANKEPEENKEKEAAK